MAIKALCESVQTVISTGHNKIKRMHCTLIRHPTTRQTNTPAQIMENDVLVLIIYIVHEMKIFDNHLVTSSGQIIN